MAFCIRCGEELAEEAVFCPKCGQAVSGKKEQVSTSVASVKPSRNTKVGTDELVGAGVTETIFQDRIDPVDDRDVNDHLFTLYSKLISPLTEIENYTQQINEKTAEVEYNSKFHVIKPPVRIFAIVAAFVVVYAVCGWGLDWPALPFFPRSLKNAIENYDVVAGWIIEPIKWGAVVSIFAAVILTIYSNIYNKMSIPRLKQEILDVSQKRDAVVAKIRDYVCYVPPSYRFSAALTYFVDSYRNTRCSNLQEAVREYDSKERHEEIMQMMYLIYEAVAEIESNQLVTQAQLSSINSSIWAANFLF